MSNKRFFYMLGCTCPEGYIQTSEGCETVEFVNATEPTSPQNAVSTTSNNYSIYGSWIYSFYNLNGTGISSQIPLTNNFWKNGPGDLSAVGNQTDGPLNRVGVWATTQSSGQQVGFSICIDVPITKVYYIGFGSDNFGILRVDGQTIIQQDPASLDTQYNMTTGTSTFRVWHIYPIILNQGSRVIELIGENIGGPATIGAEIYNATASELISATSYDDLGDKLLFSTKDYVGDPIQIGSDGYGYECPIGYSLQTCELPYSCKRIVTIPCQ